MKIFVFIDILSIYGKSVVECLYKRYYSTMTTKVNINRKCNDKTSKNENASLNNFQHNDNDLSQTMKPEEHIVKMH